MLYERREAGNNMEVERIPVGIYKRIP